MLSPEQLELRRGGLTATDLARIVTGQFGGAIGVWLSKRGVEAPQVDTPRTQWGEILEGPIRQNYAERHKVDVWVPGTLQHPDEPWALATPDGICYRVSHYARPLRGWECKTHTVWLKSEYGEAGSDEVPEYELVQCAWNLFVARAVYREDLTRWDLTAFLDGLPTDYTIERDIELEETLVELGRQFWSEHVVGGQPLEPDGSEAYSNYLKGKFPSVFGDMREANGTYEQALFHNYRELLRQRAWVKTELEKRKQRIQELIGDAPGLVWTEKSKTGRPKTERLLWRKTNPSTQVDWRSAFEALREQLGEPGKALADQAQKQYTSQKPGHRRFVVPRSWSKS